MARLYHEGPATPVCKSLVWRSSCALIYAGAMPVLPLDAAAIAECRSLAYGIASDVQTLVERRTTAGVERTTARALGVEGVDRAGVPLANVIVDRALAEGRLGRGICTLLGEALLEGAADIREAAERLAYEKWSPKGAHSRAELEKALKPHVKTALARIDGAREARLGNKAKYPEGAAPLKYVIVATGNIYDDALQTRAAGHAGADIVAVIRATAQSLLDYVPEGPTTEGYGGTYATQDNFRIIRDAADAVAVETGRYVAQTNYSSGLCMSEIAWMGAVERMDMLLNDAMYGILFRDINMERTLIDQSFSRRIVARAKMMIHTGEDNYLTTADAVEKGHTVIASQFINEALALHAGLTEEQMGLGHAFEINPWLEDSLLLEIAQAQLIRQLFPKHPIKWMPPTKFKTGDIFHSHVHDAMFNLTGALTNQSIELLGMFSEAVHTPLLMDRYLSLKSAKYIFGAAKHLGDEIEFKKGGIIERRALHVFSEAQALLQEVAGETIFHAISRGAFADVKRARTGGKGYAGVVDRQDYLNPFWDSLAKGGR